MISASSVQVAKTGLARLINRLQVARLIRRSLANASERRHGRWSEEIVDFIGRGKPEYPYFLLARAREACCGPHASCRAVFAKGRQIAKRDGGCAFLAFSKSKKHSCQKKKSRLNNKKKSPKNCCETGMIEF